MTVSFQQWFIAHPDPSQRKIGPENSNNVGELGMKLDLVIRVCANILNIADYLLTYLKHFDYIHLLNTGITIGLPRATHA
jgi:hypothetical protein